MNMRIGSGDVSSLMMGVNTKGFQDLLRMFVSDTKPRYNALASPIDACRAGAILEDRYLLCLPEGYYSQYEVVNPEMDVFVATLDFARIENGAVVDFDELKTIGLNDFIDIIEPLRGRSESDYLPTIKKTFKKYYMQIQEQLYCSRLDGANLVFLAVESYEDEDNYKRMIKEKDFVKFRICRDCEAIESIKAKGLIFQTIKDYFR